MTTPAEIIPSLRMLTNEPSTEVFSDADLGDLILSNTDEDGVFDLNSAVAAIWRIKAARYAGLVDVSEAGSSRKFSDLHKNALGMAAKYEGLAAGVGVEGAITARPRTRAIVRPEA